jgi:hypothetical protein
MYMYFPIVGRLVDGQETLRWIRNGRVVIQVRTRDLVVWNVGIYTGGRTDTSVLLLESSAQRRSCGGDCRSPEPECYSVCVLETV